jgi:hypothetical protein
MMKQGTLRLKKTMRGPCQRASGIFAVLLGLSGMLSPICQAGVFEVSAGFYYNGAKYSASDYQSTTRFGFSVGYFFTELSSVELAYASAVERTFVTGLQDTTFADRVYSLNYVQHFLSRESRFQPYGKLGIGQLNRDGSGTYSGGGAPPAQYDAVTGVVGLGFKFFFTQNLAFRSEATSYLAKGQISSWQDNIAISVGGSFLF